MLLVTLRRRAPFFCIWFATRFPVGTQEWRLVYKNHTRRHEPLIGSEGGEERGGRVPERRDSQRSQRIVPALDMIPVLTAATPHRIYTKSFVKIMANSKSPEEPGLMLFLV